MATSTATSCASSSCAGCAADRTTPKPRPSDSLLVVFQGTDGSGKDSMIKAVFGGLNPLWLRCDGFKAATFDEIGRAPLVDIARGLEAQANWLDETTVEIIISEAQNEVTVGQPTGVVGPNVIPEFWARPKLSPSAKNGGFCQRPWAPWLQAES